MVIGVSGAVRYKSQVDQLIPGYTIVAHALSCFYDLRQHVL